MRWTIASSYLPIAHILHHLARNHLFSTRYLPRARQSTRQVLSNADADITEHLIRRLAHLMHMRLFALKPPSRFPRAASSPFQVSSRTSWGSAFHDWAAETLSRTHLFPIRSLWHNGYKDFWPSSPLRPRHHGALSFWRQQPLPGAWASSLMRETILTSAKFSTSRKIGGYCVGYDLIFCHWLRPLSISTFSFPLPILRGPWIACCILKVCKFVWSRQIRQFSWWSTSSFATCWSILSRSWYSTRLGKAGNRKSKPEMSTSITWSETSYFRGPYS